MIELSEVHKAFGANRVLQGVNLTIASGTSMVIIGGSGTGKSVALKCILGLIHPDSGTITLDGQDAYHPVILHSRSLPPLARLAQTTSVRSA